MHCEEHTPVSVVVFKPGFNSKDLQNERYVNNRHLYISLYKYQEISTSLIMYFSFYLQNMAFIKVMLLFMIKASVNSLEACQSILCTINLAEFSNSTLNHTICKSISLMNDYYFLIDKQIMSCYRGHWV